MEKSPSYFNFLSIRSILFSVETATESFSPAYALWRFAAITITNIRNADFLTIYLLFCIGKSRFVLLRNSNKFVTILLRFISAWMDSRSEPRHILLNTGRLQLPARTKPHEHLYFSLLAGSSRIVTDMLHYCMTGHITPVYRKANLTRLFVPCKARFYVSCTAAGYPPIVQARTISPLSW